MVPTILTGSANVPLAEAIAKRLAVTLVPRTLERFPDGEMHVEVQRSVCGDDVYLVQPTGPPVDGNLLELMLLADACRRDGARRLTTVVPYLGTPGRSPSICTAQRSKAPSPCPSST